MMEGGDAKLPLFHGNGTDNPEQYWFLCEAVWTVKQTMDDEVNKGQLETSLQGRPLDWFLKFVQIPIGGP